MDIKRIVPYLVVSFCIIVMMADFTIKYDPLQELGKKLQYSVGVILNFSIAVGVVFQCFYHAKNVNQRGKHWKYSVITWVWFLFFVIVAVAAGTKGDLYQFFFKGTMLPAWWATHGFLIFYVMSATYRGYRARSVESLFMVILAVVALLGAAPATRALFPTILGPVFDWLVGVLSTGVNRGLLITTFLGSLAFLARVLIGKERVTGGD